MKIIKKVFSGWIIPIVAALIISLVIRKFVFFNIIVPTESMFPTIMIGDRISVTRIYNKDKLKRGDIVVFHSDELKMDLVKRLIGLPGDKIEVKEDGSVYVNSDKLDEPYVSSGAVKFGDFKVPAESFFFLGDNRQVSKDSRYWDNPYINERDIMGVARITIFPINRFSILK
ncbi:MAG: signal peptidase I [Clostridiaceae bacterium]|nr:signal peptidase I [Clostridiaceae bacterium]